MVKKIHYCWFGGKELPSKVKKCIATWKKMLPDYEIKEWNEENFDINTNTFVKEAYENKKWAFVSDYVRIYALYNEGGIYLDTDVKILKDISHITDKDMFLGYEDSGYVGTAVIGVKEKENKYIKEILDYYNKIEHFNEEIMYNYVNPVIITKILKKYSSKVNEQGIRIFDNNVYVYPRDYFFPLNYNYSEKLYTENTCMVHLFNATWTGKGEKRTVGIYRRFGPNLGKKINDLIDGCFNLKNSILRKIKGIYNFARMQYSIHINIPKRIKKINQTLSDKKENYITICHPEMVEYNDGIYELFNGNILNIREMHTRKEAKKVAKEIVDSGKKNIIFNSYADGWDMIISELKMIKRDISIKIIIHDEMYLMSEKNNWNLVDSILDLYNKGYINELAFFKESLYQFYNKKGYNVKKLIRPFNIKDKQKYLPKENKREYLKIGMYNACDTVVKNPYNQLSAISLLENAKLDYAPINYKITMIARKYNINLCDASTELTKEELYKRMADNDINLFISAAETSSLHPLKSLELGTICLVGNSFEYFDGSELEKYIVVEKENNIMDIYNKIMYALENKDKILELYNEWKKGYTVKAKEYLDEFVDIK